MADTGRWFTPSNFEAIRKVALSDKPPHEAIGNKGLGFKSVLEVCDSPEIHSVANGDSIEFDGYCFRFPRAEDVTVPACPHPAPKTRPRSTASGAPLPSLPVRRASSTTRHSRIG